MNDLEWLAAHLLTLNAKEQQMSHQSENGREFERYCITLNAEVKSIGERANELSEITKLQDISGGGARFVTAHPDYYGIGKKVDLIIQLPGGDTLNTKMEGAGRVVWMGEMDEGEVSVGLCMDDLMVFEHIVDGSD